ncbi:hypothetical protein [Sediminibacillus massiliensis]|uniref:hypothetical protein n=1 Tax=Sediminibacillus massiliensis TaxID=1926277 RepID=UPI001FE91A7A|nr:hypothetical protein [Sediminibacillus massiliensis]
MNVVAIRQTEQMTFGEMFEYTKRFNEIMECSTGDIRDFRLAALMSDLEERYLIPAFHNEAFEADHPELMQLFRSVSMARSL